MKKRGQIHNKIAVVLSSGEPISVEDIHKIFAGTKIEPVLYRLSTFIWKIKKNGGVIKPIKDKRKVLAYQLINAKEFDSNGYWVGTITEKKAA